MPNTSFNCKFQYLRLQTSLRRRLYSAPIRRRHASPVVSASPPGKIMSNPNYPFTYPHTPTSSRHTPDNPHFCPTCRLYLPANIHRPVTPPRTPPHSQSAITNHLPPITHDLPLQPYDVPSNDVQAPTWNTPSPSQYMTHVEVRGTLSTPSRSDTPFNNSETPTSDAPSLPQYVMTHVQAWGNPNTRGSYRYPGPSP